VKAIVTYVLSDITADSSVLLYPIETHV